MLTNANGQHYTKNDHFKAMIGQVKERGLKLDYVAFDSWYGGLDNLKHLRKEEFGQQYHFLTRLKSNRQVNPEQQELLECSRGAQRAPAD